MGEDNSYNLDLGSLWNVHSVEDEGRVGAHHGARQEEAVAVQTIGVEGRDVTLSGEGYQLGLFVVVGNQPPRRRYFTVLFDL